MRKIVLILILLLITSLLNAQTATILYFNDAHEIAPVFDDLGERGGISRVKAIVDEIKRENPHTLVIFGGDCAGGTLFGAIYHGLPMVEAFNKIPVDIANFGQHDFDFGLDENLKLIQNSQFDWITSNLINDKNEPYADLPIYKIVELSGITIGFIGLTDAMTTTTRSENIQQKNLLEAAAFAVKQLVKHDVDIIVAITQTNLETNENLMMNFPEIDAILTEERSEIVTEIYYCGERPIISPCGNMGSIARLNFTKSQNTLNISLQIYPVDASVESDIALKELEDSYQNKLEKELSSAITYLKTPLVAGITSDHASRWKETNIGNLLTDSFRDYYGADIAILNGGGIRADAAAGPFTVKNAQAIIPFGNQICLIEMSGKKILQILEHGSAAVEEKAGRFLQISGAKYRYDWIAEAGNRIVGVTIGNEKLDENKMYTVALPDYILEGGDGFDIQNNCTVLVTPDSAPKDIEIFINYCRKMKEVDVKLEGRITVINKDVAE